MQDRPKRKDEMSNQRALQALGVKLQEVISVS